MPRRLTAAEQKKLPGEFRIAGAGVATITAAAEGEGDDGKPKLGTFEGNAYTGAPMQPGGWFGTIVCDLDGFDIPSQHRPALRQHSDDQIVGHTNTVKIDSAGVKVAGVFSGEKQHTDKVTVPALNGFQWQLSIGASPDFDFIEWLDEGETATVNGRKVTGPMAISRKTELKEISFVPLGADGDTSVSVSASRRRIIVFKGMLKSALAGGAIKAGKYSDGDVDKMSEDEAKAALKECMADDDDPPPPKEDDDEDTDKEENDAKARADKAIKARRKAEAEEDTRIEGIRATVKARGVTTVQIGGKPVNLAAHAIAEGWTVDKAELEALKAARPGAGVGGPHFHFVNAPQLNEAVLEAAVLHAARHQMKLEDNDYYFDRSPDGRQVRRVPEYMQREVQANFRTRYSDQVQQAAHTLFKGRIGFQQLIQAAFQANGSTSQLDLKSEFGVRQMLAEWGYNEPIFRAEGASNVSVGNILSNVMNKFALQGYLWTDPAWRKFCAVRMVNDLKPSKAINLLGSVMFKQIGPIGELENAAFGDQAFANQAAPYGIIGTIPWTHLVNDDLGVLTTVPAKIGSGGGLALNDLVWALKKAMFAGTINGDDGNAFYRTTSLVTAAAAREGKAYKPNKMTGGASALSATSLQTAKGMFDNQIDPNGNPLGASNSKPILLHGPSNWQTVSSLMMAPAIVYGGASAALQPNANMWQGYAEPVMSPYMENANYVNSATAWELLCDPAAYAAIEIVFYGSDTPAVLQAGPDYQFDKLGISIRGTMAMGVAQQNFRGSVYSAGA